MTSERISWAPPLVSDYQVTDFQPSIDHGSFRVADVGQSSVELTKKNIKERDGLFC